MNKLILGTLVALSFLSVACSSSTTGSDSAYTAPNNTGAVTNKAGNSGTGNAGTGNVVNTGNVAGVGTTCQAGATQACICYGNLQGVQSCSNDGSTWNACDCSGGAAGSPNAGNSGTGNAGNPSGNTGNVAGGGTCIPKTCEQISAEASVVPAGQPQKTAAYACGNNNVDGCGHNLNCGTCADGSTCGTDGLCADRCTRLTSSVNCDGYNHAWEGNCANPEGPSKCAKVNGTWCCI